MLVQINKLDTNFLNIFYHNINDFNERFRVIIDLIQNGKGELKNYNERIIKLKKNMRNVNDSLATKIEILEGKKRERGDNEVVEEISRNEMLLDNINNELYGVVLKRKQLIKREKNIKEEMREKYEKVKRIKRMFSKRNQMGNAKSWEFCRKNIWSINDELNSKTKCNEKLMIMKDSIDKTIKIYDELKEREEPLFKFVKERLTIVEKFEHSEECGEYDELKEIEVHLTLGNVYNSISNILSLIALILNHEMKNQDLRIDRGESISAMEIKYLEELKILSYEFDEKLTEYSDLRDVNEDEDMLNFVRDVLRDIEDFEHRDYDHNKIKDEISQLTYENAYRKLIGLYIWTKSLACNEINIDYKKVDEERDHELRIIRHKIDEAIKEYEELKERDEEIFNFVQESILRIGKLKHRNYGQSIIERKMNVLTHDTAFDLLQDIFWWTDRVIDESEDLSDTEFREELINLKNEVRAKREKYWKKRKVKKDSHMYNIVGKILADLKKLKNDEDDQKEIENIVIQFTQKNAYDTLKEIAKAGDSMGINAIKKRLFIKHAEPLCLILFSFINSTYRNANEYSDDLRSLSLEFDNIDGEIKVCDGLIDVLISERKAMIPKGYVEKNLLEKEIRNLHTSIEEQKNEMETMNEQLESLQNKFDSEIKKNNYHDYYQKLDEIIKDIKQTANDFEDVIKGVDMIEENAENDNLESDVDSSNNIIKMIEEFSNSNLEKYYDCKKDIVDYQKDKDDLEKEIENMHKTNIKDHDKYLNEIRRLNGLLKKKN